jgi:hypothetical protein
MGVGGFPRIVPVKPSIDGGQLLVLAPHAADDLRRDDRYAFHTEGADDVDDEFYVTGSALDDQAGRLTLDIERALLATYRPRAEGNTWPPRYEKWSDPDVAPSPPAVRAQQSPAGLPWREFAASEPEIAGLVRAQIRFVGIGLGYLATLRPDGGPRLHPFCPTFSGDGLYGLIAPTPKQRDLLRDPRCAVHACLFPASPNRVELTCVALHRADPALLEQVHASAAADGMTSSHDEELFEFHLVEARLTEETGDRRSLEWRAAPQVA